MRAKGSKVNRVAVLVAVAGLLSSIAHPVGAAVTRLATGVIAFTGTAMLPQFPCAGGGCTGSFEGEAVVTLAGSSAGNPWTAIALSAPIEAGFAYGDSCFGVGLAEGTGSISGFATGTYGPQLPMRPSQLGLPKSVTAVEVPFDFSWTRVGLTAVLEVQLGITLTVDSMGEVEVIRSRMASGIATFVLTSVPDCLGGGSPIEAEVGGSIVLPPA